MPNGISRSMSSMDLLGVIDLSWELNIKCQIAVLLELVYARKLFLRDALNRLAFLVPVIDFQADLLDRWTNNRPLLLTSAHF